MMQMVFSWMCLLAWVDTVVFNEVNKTINIINSTPSPPSARYIDSRAGA